MENHQWIAHEVDFMVRESHLDFNGHMNNVAYVQFFENALWDMFTARGFGMSQINAVKQGPVILSITLDFVHEVYLRNKIRIKTCYESYEGKVGYMIAEMVSESNQLICRAKYAVALFDMATRRIIGATPEWLLACGKADVSRV